MWNRLNLFLRKSGTTQSFAMLGKNKLTPASKARPSLTQLPKFGGDLTVTTTIKLKTTDHMVQGIRHMGKHSPPITRRASGGARVRGWLTILAEQGVIIRQYAGVGFRSRYFS